MNVFTQDSTPFPVTTKDFTYFNPALGGGFKSIWSMFRIAAVQMKYIPRHPNETAGTTLPGLGYVMYDRDGHEQAFSTWAPSNFETQSSRVLYSMQKPWKYFKRSMKYPMKSKIPTMDPNTAVNNNQNLAGMWHGIGDSIGVTTGAFGCHIAMYIGDLTVSYSYGTIILTGYFCLKDRL